MTLMKFQLGCAVNAVKFILDVYTRYEENASGQESAEEVSNLIEIIIKYRLAEEEEKRAAQRARQRRRNLDVLEDVGAALTPLAIEVLVPQIPRIGKWVKQKFGWDPDADHTSPPPSTSETGPDPTSPSSHSDRQSNSVSEGKKNVDLASEEMKTKHTSKKTSEPLRTDEQGRDG